MIKPTGLLIIATLLTALAPTFSFAANQPATPSSMLTLAQDGQTKYSIVVAADAIPSEKTAAAQLQDHLQKITGANFAIKSEAEAGTDGPQILIGASPRVKRLLPAQNWNSLGHDGIVVKTIGQNLILAGGRPRGTLYAVNEFLEKSAGVRWWTPTESTIPQKSTLTVAPQNIVYTPTFSYREHFTTGVRWNPDFAARLRQNGHYQTKDENFGGNYNVLGFVHTFDQLLPPEKYFKDHPEWYSDPDNGNKPCTAASRIPPPQRSQLNLSNDAMRAELTKNALEWIRKEPNAGMISISQNDNNNKCINPVDMALEEKEGSASGPLLRFVNAVAADIEKEYPDFLVETLAYTYTQKPPRTIRPRGNVVVRLCNIGADFARPLTDKANQDFQTDMAGWRTIAPKLYVWDYVTNYHLTLWPYPNLNVLGPNLRYLAKNKAFGVFLEGDAYTNETGDFANLRVWLLGKLLWNPYQDESKLIDEFLTGYYGAAAPHLRAYLNEIQQEFLATGKPLNTFQSDQSYLTLPLVNRLWSHYQAAQAAVANDPVLSQRVRRERLALDNVIITRYPELKIEAANGTPAPAVPENIVAFIDDFITVAKSVPVRLVRAQTTFGEYEGALRGRYREALPLPEPLLGQIAPEEIATRIIDAQEDQYRYYRKGELGDIADDALASDGKAARLIGQSDDWILQYDIPGSSEYLKSKSWHAYAMVRAEIKPDADPEGLLFTGGVYDTVRKISHLDVAKKLGDLSDGQYHLVDLGALKLDSESYLWVAPPRRDDIVAIYIDRLILVRDAETPQP